MLRVEASQALRFRRHLVKHKSDESLACLLRAARFDMPCENLQVDIGQA